MNVLLYNTLGISINLKICLWKKKKKNSRFCCEQSRNFSESMFFVKKKRMKKKVLRYRMFETFIAVESIMIFFPRPFVRGIFVFLVFSKILKRIAALANILINAYSTTAEFMNIYCNGKPEFLPIISNFSFRVSTKIAVLYPA